jgi:hypothetical protein
VDDVTRSVAEGVTCPWCDIANLPKLNRGLNETGREGEDSLILAYIPYNATLALLGVMTIIVVLWIGSSFAVAGEDVEESLGLIVGVVFMALRLTYFIRWAGSASFSGAAATQAARNHCGGAYFSLV